MVVEFFRAASRAGAALASVALTRGIEREHIVSLSSAATWRAFAAGDGAPYVLHDADPCFGLGARR